MRTYMLMIAVVVIYGVLAGSALAAAPDNFTVLVPSNHAVTGAGAIGSYVYHPSDGRFYVATFGSGQELRVFAGPGESVPVWPAPFSPANVITDTVGKSWQVASASILSRVVRSLDIDGGKFDSLLGGTAPSLSGAIVNPKPVVFNGYSYAAGELAIFNNNSTASTVAATKRLLTFDFREIWSPTTQQPDRANAEYDSGILETTQYGIMYGYGCTNWNDTFNSLMTLGDMANAIGASVPVSITTDQVGGRRSTFSADGSKVYFVSADSRSGRQFTGVWSAELATKTVRWLFNDTLSTVKRTIAEPASVLVGVRNFTGQSYPANTNQVLFNGTDASGNVGGINVLVDDGSATPSIYPAVTAEAVMDFLGMDPATPLSERPGYMSITADEEGNLYLYSNTPYYALYKYDTMGRLIAVGTRLQHYAFNCDITGTATQSNTAYLRADVRNIPNPYNENETIVQVMYMSSAGKCVAGVNVYKPCDFDRDGSVTLADLNFFKTQIQKTWTATVPMIADGNSYTDYIMADLDGDGMWNGNLDTTKPPVVIPTGVAAPCVTENDRKVLYQFVTPGSINLDEHVDFSDFVVLAQNFGGTNKDWSQGDFDFDGDVDVDDLVLLSAHWLE